MITLILMVQLITALSFFYYGIATFISKKMRAEFKRYRFSRFRVLTGVLQIAGAGGLLLGVYYPILTLAASAGLAMMMVFAMGIRLRIGDPLYAKIPAFIYFLMNSFLFLKCLQALLLDPTPLL